MIYKTKNIVDIFYHWEEEFLFYCFQTFAFCMDFTIKSSSCVTLFAAAKYRSNKLFNIRVRKH